MKILVVGHQGQLAQSLAEVAGARGRHELVLMGRPDLDLARAESLDAAMEQVRPDLLVNAAAYTQVDKAESEPDQAWAVNCDGAGALAAAAFAAGLPIIHVSTDYVFDGCKTEPYREDDPTGPTSVYGGSKLAGESKVQSANPRHLILRTAWVYSPYGNNFLKTMLRLAGERPELRVVADQFGSPTYAPHLATAILAIADHLAAGRIEEASWGTFHCAGTGATSWHGLAEAIIAESARRGGPQVPVHPIVTADYPTPARRPANSRLDCTRLARTWGLALPPWQEGVRACVARVFQDHTRLCGG